MTGPQFRGVREAAANLGHGASPYTEDLFREDFPQFYLSLIHI